MEEMGCPPTPQLQKHIYLHACYELYPEKLEKATQGWVFDSKLDLPGVRMEVEKILSNDNIDRSFSKEFTTELKNPRRLIYEINLKRVRRFISKARD